MKAIMLMFDSLNRHYLEPYGCDRTITPNFTRLAEHTVRFEQCYAGSLPCIPARRELHTGRYNFFHNEWGPLEPFDDSMPEMLKKQGIYTHLITDHHHYFEDQGTGYHTKYNSWELIRGQEIDAWVGAAAKPERPDWLNLCTFDHCSKFGREPEGKTPVIIQNFLKSMTRITDESRYPQVVTVDSALDFLDRNREEDNWFLHVENFDPHEPFAVPDRFRDMYGIDKSKPRFLWPDYGEVKQTEVEVERLRAEYSALLTMCDEQLGRILDKMDELDLWKDTLLIVNTDHGFLLGEHNYYAKILPPYYNELAHTPLFLWDPRCDMAGETSDMLVQTIDIAPTILEFFGIRPTEDMEGKSISQHLMSGEKIRDYAFWGHYGGHINCTDGRYVYMLAAREGAPDPYFYTLSPAHMRAGLMAGHPTKVLPGRTFAFSKGLPLWRIQKTPIFVSRQQEFGTLLYDLDSDPGQERPLEDEAVSSRLKKAIREEMKANDAPEEAFDRYGL